MAAGERIREEREKRGWTQGDLSEHSDTNRDTISGIESGRHRPRPSTLRKIAGAFGIEVRELFEVSTPKAAYPPALNWSDEQYAAWVEDATDAELTTMMNELGVHFPRSGTPLSQMTREEQVSLKRCLRITRERKAREATREEELMERLQERTPA